MAVRQVEAVFASIEIAVALCRIHVRLRIENSQSDWSKSVVCHDQSMAKWMDIVWQFSLPRLWNSSHTPTVWRMQEQSPIPNVETTSQVVGEGYTPCPKTRQGCMPCSKFWSRILSRFVFSCQKRNRCATPAFGTMEIQTPPRHTSVHSVVACSVHGCAINEVSDVRSIWGGWQRWTRSMWISRDSLLGSLVRNEGQRCDPISSRNNLAV